MQPTPALAALSIVAALAACSSRSNLGSGRDSTTATATATPSDPARIDRVLSGLRPSVEVVGRDPTRWAIAERMAYHNVPGVSVAVIEGGRVAWARGVGLKQTGGTDSVTPTTLFQAASISKPVSATATLRLIERGTLDLDADVNTYLRSWKVPDNKFTASEKVTLRRILSHSAGLTVHGFPGYETSEPLPTTVQVLDGAKPANTPPVRVDTTPGAIGRYSGGGTTVMQQLLVDVTGTPFPALMRELVLGPAGMSSSTFEQPLPASRAKDAARAHNQRGETLPGGWHVYPEMAPAGLWTTPTDLAKWAIAIADARAGRSTSVLSQRMATQMLTEVKDGFGLGPTVQGTGKAFRFGHGGANAGFHCELVYFPELGVGAAVMTNGDRGPLLMREVLYAVAKEYGWPDYGPKQVTVTTLDSASLAGIAGAYTLQAGAGIPVTIRQEKGRLVFTAPQIPPQEELLPQSDSMFTLSSLGWQVTFTRDGAGRATGFTVTRPQGPAIQGTRSK